MDSNTSSNDSSPTTDDETSPAPKPFKPDWRVWAILLSLSVAALCAIMEGTIIPIALPTIVAALGGGSSYLWVPNAFFLASVATLPLFAQTSDIFGRRWLLLGALALFVFGSGLCGGSTSMGMLIAARTIQGIGSGGVNLLVETVVTDLVPMRERGKYLSLVILLGTLGAAIGPFIGGAIAQNTSWRWVFYINLPIGGAALVLLYIFLRVNHQRGQTWPARLKRVDFGGNIIFIAAVSAVLIALTWGGPVYEWDTYHIIVPLVLGFVGLILFIAFEWTPKLALEPSVPRVLVSNRTSTAALIMTMLYSMETYWTFYFLPIYFQAIKGKSPLRAGVDTLPTFVSIMPFGILGGVILSKTGRYKPLHILSWLPIIASFGLFSIMDKDSGPAMWVCFQLLASLGNGLLAATILPAVQAPLEEKYMSTATGLWAFARGFGGIWGVTIPSALFNNQCRKYALLISDASIVARFRDGDAYEIATKAFLDTLSDDNTREQVIEVFTKSMQTVWYAGIAFSGAGLLVCFLQREIPLRTELNTEYGIVNSEAEKKPSAEPRDLEMSETSGCAESSKA